MQEPQTPGHPQPQDIRAALRSITRTHYDGQKLRIEVGNRLCANFRVTLGQEPGMPTDEMSPEAQKLLVQLKDEYKRLADVVAKTPPARWSKALATHEGLIRSPFDLALAQRYFDLLDGEERAVATITVLLRAFPIWTQFLEGVRGCGPLMSACIISELDPHKARYPSSFWKYCGLDTGPDGKGRSRRAEHLVTRPYTTKDGEEKERQGITFNPFIRTKLVGVLAGSFLRSASPYRVKYDDYKHRLESRPEYGLVAEAAKVEGATKGHRHAMAQRYMVKEFLADLWRFWRELEGLPVVPRYNEAKLSLVHGQERLSQAG
jgi:hypothetical protein